MVWRRFHDIKKLHREIKKRHKSLGLPGYVPEPIDCSFFKRFDRDVIQKRKVYILSLLDFAAGFPELYKSHSFAQFFNETTPSNKIQKFVQKAARSFSRSLELETDDEVIIEKQKTHIIESSSSNDVVLEEEDVAETESENIENKFVVGDNEGNVSNTKTTTTKYNLRFLTPMASVESEDSDYIYDAALVFSQAVQAEANLDYMLAYDQYKNGVDILLTGCKGDQNEDRVYIARAKITKYLARADDIYERFLKTPSACNIASTISTTSNFQLSVDVSGNTNSESSGLYLERPYNHMAKYKVISLLGHKVLLVSCITEPLKPKYVMKGVEKPSSNSPTQTVFLPHHVPYMVDLVAFFQSDQKIFLLLKLALGGKLIDYIHSRACNSVNNIGAEEKETAGDIARPSFNVSELVCSSKQLLQSVSNTLQNVEISPRKVSYIGAYRVPESLLKKWSQQLLVAVHALHEKSVILW